MKRCRMSNPEWVASDAVSDTRAAAWFERGDLPGNSRKTQCPGSIELRGIFRSRRARFPTFSGHRKWTSRSVLARDLVVEGLATARSLASTLRDDMHRRFEDRRRLFRRFE